MKTKLIEFIIRSQRLKPLAMARYAKEHTDFYRDFYKGIQMDSFTDLPVLTKDHFASVSPYSLLSKPFAGKVYMYGETSGSSGSPSPSFLTRKDFEGQISLSLLCPYAPAIKSVLQSNRTAVNGLTFGFTIAGFSFGALLQKSGALVAQLGSRSTIAVPERTAGAIRRLKPGVISSTPLDFMSWMEIIRQDYPQSYDEIMDSVNILISAAEPCAPSRMRQIEKHFGLQHVNVYASVDGFVSIPCPCGEMHLLKNLHYIELYDRDMNSLGDLGTGRLCFTNLVRKSTPMVKYLLDDLVTIKESQCPHGFKKSIAPHGRYELSLELKNRTWGNLDFEEIIYRYGLFMDYQVAVTETEIAVDLEEYPAAKSSYDLFGLKKALTEETGLKSSVKILPLGKLTNYRDVRKSKSIIKVRDLRINSRQVIPQVL